MHPDRRTFLASVGLALAAPRIVRARPTVRYPIAFSTLGCPDWPWKRILDEADRLGYAAVELRGIAGEMDLPKVPELAPTRLAGTRKGLSALGLSVCSLGASASMHERDAAARGKNLDEARRYIDLAHALGVKHVRVFGDEVPPGEPREEVTSRIVEGLRELAAYAAPAGVAVLLESHGDFTRSPDLAGILERVSSEARALLWDAHHTFVTAHEAPTETFERVGRWVRHTHLKDSRAVGAERRYVLTGTGEVPVRGQVQMLARAGYAGYYGFEWEKKWHPEIEDPDVAFPHFARTAGEYLAAAGVVPR
jgi:sugar phosphate isomerase/epimerase